MIDLFKKFFFSTRLMSFLFLAFAVAMAFGTFIESWYSTDTARIWIYNTKWFEAIMVFFVINFLGNMFRYRLFRWEKWPVLLLHISWILIILGAFVTRYMSFEGMMFIREGETENVMFTDKTYVSAIVYGDVNGETMQKVYEENDVIITQEAFKGDFPMTESFKDEEFKIDYVDFIKGAKEGLIPDENGSNFLKIVESGGGTRHDHYLEEGEVANIHNILFSLNKETKGAINITTTDSTYYIHSPFQGTYMRMADQMQGSVSRDTIQPLQLRSLYQMAKMQFVIPDRLIKAKKGVVPVPEAEQNPNTLNAVVVDVTSNGETVRKKLLGRKHVAQFTDKFKVGNLEFLLCYGSRVHTMPFGVTLNDFIAEKFPGTESGYKSFMSKVTVNENDKKLYDYDIFMNNILDHKGYRLFQASFDPDEKGTHLSVNHDFWGTWITYIGYFMLFAGLLGIMFFGKTRFRDLSKSLNKVAAKKKKLTTILLLGMVLNLSAQEQQNEHQHDKTQQEQIDSLILATAVSKEHADAFGKLVIQDYGGRMKPINTFSSELLRKLSLKSTFNKLNSDQVFLSMIMNKELWANVEIIALEKASKRGKNDSIRNILGMPKGQTFAKMLDFFDTEGRYKLEPYLRDATATNNPNQFQKDFKEAAIRLNLLDLALSGQIVKIFPLLDDDNNKWISALEYRGGQYKVSDTLYANFIKNSIPYYISTLHAATQTGDYTDADKLLEAFKQNQKNHGAEVMPSEKKINTEIIYNKLNIFNILYRSYGLIGLLMFFVLVFQIFKDRSIWRVAVYFFKGTIILLFLWHTAGLVLRWYISGHAPWSDAYESIIYVAWATLGMGLLFGRKSNLTIAAATFVTSLLLFVAHQNWVDPAISNLVPVLDSYWLMIHVSIIVGSYGPLTVGMILGVTSLLLIIMTTKKNKERIEINLKELSIINEMVLIVGLVMLTIGNFLGGMWANESWGRYWGWDPKETWALISIMVYAFIIHMRLVPGLRGRWIFNFMTIIGFLSIMMTYFGVNYYLVGLHSYGSSGSAAITPDYVKYIVLGVFIFGGISYWRYKANYGK